MISVFKSMRQSLGEKQEGRGDSDDGENSETPVGAAGYPDAGVGQHRGLRTLAGWETRDISKEQRSENR